MVRKNIFTDPNRGALAEWTIGRVLNSWRKSKKILDFIVSKELDTVGIDVLVIIREGLSVPVQIKSSSGHIRNHFILHPNILFLFLVEDFPVGENDSKTIAIVEEKFKLAINEFAGEAIKRLLDGSKKIRVIKG